MIRVHLVAGGRLGPEFELSADRQEEDDRRFEFEDGVALVMDKDLYDEARPVCVDFGPMGFVVRTGLGGGCEGGDCGSCGFDCG